MNMVHNFVINVSYSINVRVEGHNLAEAEELIEDKFQRGLIRIEEDYLDDTEILNDDRHEIFREDSIPDYTISGNHLIQHV